MRFPLVVLVASVLATACSNPAAADAPQLVPPPSNTALLEPVAVVASPEPSSPVPTSTGRVEIRRLLIGSAQRHGVNPYLVMGVAWWESGWNQSVVSATGAVGIMQVEPATAASAGPRLLHRAANVHDPADNIELGVAVLRQDLDLFHGDLSKALVAYYEGPAAVTDWNDQDAGARRYVWGVYRLAVAFSNGAGPA